MTSTLGLSTLTLLNARNKELKDTPQISRRHLTSELIGSIFCLAHVPLIFLSKAAGKFLTRVRGRSQPTDRV